MFDPKFDLTELPNDDYYNCMRGKQTREEISELLMRDPKHNDVTAY